MKVVLIGAGASAGTVGAMAAPMARDFGQRLAELVPNWPEAFPNLAQAVDQWAALAGGDPARWPLDGVWTLVDNYAKLRPILEHLGLPEYPAVSTELRRAILEVYGQLCVEMLPYEPEGTLVDVLRKLSIGDAVVSMNYDVLVEEIAHRCGIELVLADPRNRRPVGAGIILAKPHGSVSWRQWVPEQGRRVRLEDVAMAPAEVGPAAGGGTCQPLVVGPVPFKSDILSPEIMVRGDTPDAYAVLAHQWREACRALQQADEVVVVGYGFPAEDLYARFLFQEARRAAANQRCAVTLYERPERRVEVSAAIIEISAGLGRPVEIDYRGPVE